MRLRHVILGTTLLFACEASAAERMFEPSYADAPVATSGLQAVAPDSPATRLLVGDRAPVFSYLAPDGRWYQFSALCARGPVLLLFGAGETELKSLENVLPLFADLGITPAAVVDRRCGSAASLGRRLRLSCPIITDPKRAIAGLYNSLDASTQGHAPSFFVIDETRNIRALGHGPLPAPMDLLAVSSYSLGRPLPASAGTDRLDGTGSESAR